MEELFKKATEAINEMAETYLAEHDTRSHEDYISKRGVFGDDFHIQKIKTSNQVLFRTNLNGAKILHKYNEKGIESASFTGGLEGLKIFTEIKTIIDKHLCQ